MSMNLIKKQSTRRKCYFCGDVADGPAQNGRVRLAGPDMNGREFILVNGREVRAGKLYPVCEDHRAAVEAQRALGRHLGHTGRQAAEAELITGDALETAEDRAHRLPELETAVLRSITVDEFRLIQTQADMVAGRAYRGSIGHDSAIDNVIGAFCARIAQAAFRDVSDDVAADEAVFLVDRARIVRGLSLAHITRTGQTARVASINGNVSADGANDEISGLSYGDFAGLIEEDATDETDNYRVDVSDGWADADIRLSSESIAQAAFILSTLGTRNVDDESIVIMEAARDCLIRSANVTPARPVRPGLVTPAPRVIEPEAAPVVTRAATPAEMIRKATVSSPWA